MDIYEAGLKIKTYMVRDELSKILSDTKGMIGGGAILSLVEDRIVNDIDVFFPSMDAVAEALERITLHPDYKVIYNNPTACMFTIGNGIPYNFVKKRFFDNIDDLFEDFDFTCTMVGFDCRDCMVKAHAGFDTAYNEKKLIFNHKNKYPLTSLKRVLKYQKRGYTISDTEIELMGMAIANITIDDGLSFIHHVGGMYQAEGEPDSQFVSLDKVMNDYRERNPFSSIQLLLSREA